jgi:hypothetical protein
MTDLSTAAATPPGDVWQIPPERSRVIASIHGTANFLATNEDVPIPTLITFRHHLHTGTDQERLEQINRFAAAHDAERETIQGTEEYGAQQFEYARVRIETQGAEVVYVLQTSIARHPCTAGCLNPAAHAEGAHDI